MPLSVEGGGSVIDAVIRAMPWFGPALLLGGLVVTVAAALAARRAGRHVLQDVPLALAIVLVGAATLTPSGSDVRNRSCGGVDVARLLAPWAHPELLLNVLLFLPLGAAAAAVAGRRWLVPLALAVSPVVEAVQWVLPLLGRSCQGDDLVANTVGVLTGAATAYGVVLLGRCITQGPLNAAGRRG